MANDRMFLVHAPTGAAIMIAKRTNNWYCKRLNIKDELDRFFDTVLLEYAAGYTQFEIWYESEEEFRYTGKDLKGFPLLKKIRGYREND